jgi:hypothetical protein
MPPRVSKLRPRYIKNETLFASERRCRRRYPWVNSPTSAAIQEVDGKRKKFLEGVSPLCLVPSNPSDIPMKRDSADRSRTMPAMTITGYGVTADIIRWAGGGLLDSTGTYEQIHPCFQWLLPPCRGGDQGRRCKPTGAHRNIIMQTTIGI